MNLRERFTTSAILVTAALILAVLAGAIISLSSGDLGGQKSEPWTPPSPTIAPTKTPTATSIPTRTPTRTLTPTVAPSRVPPTATPTEAAATAAVEPTATAEPSVRTPASAATTAPTADQTQTPANATIVTVRYDPLSLRRGPSTGAALVGTAQFGATFTALGRSANDAWLKVCCVNNAPVWLAAEFVDLTAALSSLPVVEP